MCTARRCRGILPATRLRPRRLELTRPRPHGALCTVSPVAFQAALRHVPRGYYPRALGAALRQQLIYLPLLHVKTTTSASRYDIRSRIECTIWSKIIAEDYQQGLLDRLNEQVKGARCSLTSLI